MRSSIVGVYVVPLATPRKNHGFPWAALPTMTASHPVSASIRQVMRCDTVGVWLPDLEQVHLRQLAMDFPESKGFVREDLLHPVEGSVLGEVFKSGKPIVVGVMSKQIAPEEYPEARAEALESGCALPLISRGRTLGVLTLGSRLENSFSGDDVDFLMRAAGK